MKNRRRAEEEQRLERQPSNRDSRGTAAAVEKGKRGSAAPAGTGNENKNQQNSLGMHY